MSQRVFHVLMIVLLTTAVACRGIMPPIPDDTNDATLPELSATVRKALTAERTSLAEAAKRIGESDQDDSDQRTSWEAATATASAERSKTIGSAVKTRGGEVDAKTVWREIEKGYRP